MSSLATSVRIEARRLYSLCHFDPDWIVPQVQFVQVHSRMTRSMRSLISAFALVLTPTALHAQEIVEVPASKANVARPDDLFNLPPGQWHMAKSLAGGAEPCVSDQCEAGFTSGDL